MPDLNRRARQILPNIVVVDAVLPEAATDGRGDRASCSPSGCGGAARPVPRVLPARAPARADRRDTGALLRTVRRRVERVIMRPLRLEVEGFTCYRDRQPPLEFSGLTLFAIAGPTGAGKSSILDTMLYALVRKGSAHRQARHLRVHLAGRDSMSVALDFRVRGSAYRVTRLSKLPKSGLKSEATLAEITDGIERSIADQIRPVNDAIVSLLGLGYDEFIQTVVLPQGEFAKFLKAKPTDQRAILQHLLRHDVFARMRDLAEERRREMDAECGASTANWCLYVAATEESLATSEAMLTDARARQSEAGTAKDVADTHGPGCQASSSTHPRSRAVAFTARRRRGGYNERGARPCRARERSSRVCHQAAAGSIPGRHHENGERPRGSTERDWSRWAGIESQERDSGALASCNRRGS